MADVLEGVEPYVAEFEQMEKESPRRGPAWLDAIRREALGRFSSRGFPTARDEAYKYTSLAPLARRPFRTARAGEVVVHGDTLAQVRPAELAVREIVLAGGFVVPGLSRAALGDGSGANISEIDAAISAGAELEPLLGRLADWKRRAPIALATAMARGGVVISVPEGTVVHEPIHLLHFGAPGAASYPRVLVRVGRGASITLVETFVSSGAPSLTCATTEIEIAAGARVEHDKIQREGDAATHLHAIAVRLSRDASFTSHNVALGGKLARTELSVHLDGEGASCDLDGLYVAGASQHIDNTISVDHARPHGTSNQVYKGILSDNATAVFSGGVLVREGAQKTDARQQNRNLLLSPDAIVDTRPGLEIYADDVKCSHGATIGRLDENSVFYLRSRGIGEADARNLLVWAFASEVVRGFRLAPVRELVQRALLGRLPVDARVAEGM
jgi:Fe-S cluster assembly protein SufD